MIARWFRNIDPATARAKMAQLAEQGLARYTGVGRTMATEPGLEKLEEMAQSTRSEIRAKSQRFVIKKDS